MRILGFILILVSSNLSAARLELQALSDGVGSYRTEVRDFHLTVQLVEMGLGSVYFVKGSEKPQAANTSVDFKEIHSAELKRLADLQDGYKQSILATKQLVSSREVGALPEVPVDKASDADSPQDTKPVPRFTQASWPQFCSCARDALQLLKSKSVIQQDSSLLHLQIDQLLAMQRGDGTVIGQGMACGAPLGEFGAPFSDTSAEIRDLSALYAAKSPELLSLVFRLYRLYALSLQGKTKAPELWSFVWPTWSTRWLLGASLQPDLNLLIQQYSNYARTEMHSSKGSIVTEPNVVALQEAAKLDWDGSKIPFGFEPCRE